MTIFCNTVRVLLFKINQYPAIKQIDRCRHTKHWNPKYKKERKEKVIEVDLSHIGIDKKNFTENKKNLRLKEKGLFPQKPWFEKPMYVSCTGDIFEPYIPPEGDGKFSSMTRIGTKQNLENLLKKTKSYRALKTITKYEEEFNQNEFVHQAVNIYIKAHTALASNDHSELTVFVTEKLFPEMLYNLENKTIKWKFIQSLEPPKVVHARCTSLITDSNMFAQVTVRLHSQQVLALYDRFGRLINGSEILTKDVLEYVVFEKHLSNEYGQWRLHSKIVPSWMPIRQCITKSFILS